MGGLRKKQKRSPCSKCYGKFLNLDMFGEQISFNIHGRTHYQTGCGVIFTLAILFVTVCFGYLSAMRAMRYAEVPTILKQTKEEYFEPGRSTFQVSQESKSEPFAFAIAITNYSGFQKQPDPEPEQDQDQEPEEVEEDGEVAKEVDYGTFSMTYEITGGDDSGKTFDIAFKKCTDDDWANFYFKQSEDTTTTSTRKQAILDAHLKDDTFWCPDAFDLSFWGAKDDLDKKTLMVDFKSSTPDLLNDKELLLLLNTKKVVYDDDEKYESWKIQPYTSYHWLTILPDSPQTTTVTYTRERIYKTQDEYQRLLGEPEVFEDFVSVHDSNVVQKLRARKSNGSIASFTFDVSHDLHIESMRREKNMIDAVAIAGGVFIILVAIIGFLFSLIVPYLMHLYVIRNLFKVDNSHGKKRQSQARLENKSPQQLVREARESHKGRVKLTTSLCDSCLLVFESFIRVLTCGSNRWSRIVSEGMSQIKGELDIFNYMRRLRMTQATVNALTTFNQRRLLDSQVETSFLLQPLKPQVDSDDDGAQGGSRRAREKARRKAIMSESSSEESEEDFEFLDNELGENDALDEVSQRLLAGIIQAPPAKKKRHDKMTETEIRDRRRQKRLSKGLDIFSDSYGDEDIDEEIGGTLENPNGSETLDNPTARGKGRGRKRAQIVPEESSHPPCPQDFDADKWAKMTLEQKCAHLGIDMKEWLKMSREQQIRRMHDLANNFHFYAIDKVTDEKKFASGKKWHF